MRLGTGPGHGIDHPDLQQASLFVRAGCATASGRCTQALGEGGARSNPVKFFLSFNRATEAGRQGAAPPAPGGGAAGEREGGQVLSP